jgi:hypothetical protein
MRKPLRLVRAAAPEFDARFFERDPRFAPIVPAAKIFADYTDWPTPADLDRELGARAGVRFVVAKRRPRRQRGPVAVGDMYDAQIARGEVPTREKNWHDHMNALVWATFPRAKKALHARQHTAIRNWVGGAEVVRHLPNARTRELDALALIDEGGVLVCNDEKLVFGHALYEGFVLAVPAMIARAVPLAGPASEADAMLAERLTQPLTPDELPRDPC